MIDRLTAWDSDALVWINSHNTPLLDWIMWIASQPLSLALVLLSAFCLLTLRYEPRRWWVVLLAVLLCIFLADRLSVMAFKEVFHRLRPCHVIDNLHMFRTNCGGLYGFVSSHAANVLSISSFFVARYSCRKKAFRVSHRWLPAVLLTLWAALVCYSRPYLGKHYPGDVVCGAVLGILIGIAVQFLARWLETHLPSSRPTPSDIQ